MGFRLSLDAAENTMATVITIHPGKHLAKELKESGMSAAGLALKLDT